MPKKIYIFQKNPKLKTEWHPSKNNSHNPKKISFGSHKKVWWVCSKGHEWEASVNNRSRGSSCPYCSGTKVSDENRLTLKNPELISQWHPTKNDHLDPENISYGSNKKVWWICSKGHEWEAIVKNRSNGAGCPFCSPSTSLLEIRVFCELISIFPEAKWRHKINGIEADIFIGSLNLGIEVDGSYWHKDRNSKDKLKNKKLNRFGVKILRLRENPLQKISSIDIQHSVSQEHLVILSNLLSKIIEIFPVTQTNKKIINYEKNKVFLNNAEYKRILSYLPGPPPEESFEHEFPLLSKEWDVEANFPFKPNQFHPYSTQHKFNWICAKHNQHKWKSTIANRSSGFNCPYCAGKKVSKENSLADCFPEIALEWHPVKNNKPASKYTKSSQKKVWWQCEKGHEWEAIIGSRTGKRKAKCPHCNNEKRSERKYFLTKENILAFTNPELILEWHPTKNGNTNPHNISRGSSKKVWWQCEKEHEWEATPGNRTKKKPSGCPICSSTKNQYN